MSDLHFNTVTIIGVGLLGGSLGLAMTERGMVRHVLGVGRRQASLDAAVEVGAIDDGALELTDEALAADLIVIATPAAQTIHYLDQLRDRIGPNTIVTDVASTKAAICRHVDETWPAPHRFVGSHPMAGSEKWGPEHADAEFYCHAVTFLMTGDHLDPRARETVHATWTHLGSRVVSVAPEEHDVLVAATSHLPHIVAAALAQSVPGGEAVKAAIGSGFRDTTRIAQGRPELWRDISLTNAHAILQSLDKLQVHIDRVRIALANADAEALQAFFEHGANARKRVLDE